MGWEIHRDSLQSPDLPPAQFRSLSPTLSSTFGFPLICITLIHTNESALLQHRNTSQSDRLVRFYE